MERLERLQRENPHFKFRSPVAYNRNRHASAWLDSVVSQIRGEAVNAQSRTSPIRRDTRCTSSTDGLR
jgi:hypothetical protein